MAKGGGDKQMNPMAMMGHWANRRESRRTGAAECQVQSSCARCQFWLYKRFRMPKQLVRGGKMRTSFCQVFGKGESFGCRLQELGCGPGRAGKENETPAPQRRPRGLVDSNPWSHPGSMWITDPPHLCWALGVPPHSTAGVPSVHQVWTPSPWGETPRCADPESPRVAPRHAPPNAPRSAERPPRHGWHGSCRSPSAGAQSCREGVSGVAQFGRVPFGGEEKCDRFLRNPPGPSLGSNWEVS